MGYQDEEESPCIHHRSLFDTIPAPPSFAARKPSEPTLMSARGDFTGKGDAGEPVRVSANGRAAFRIASAMDHALDRVVAASRAAGAPHSSSETLGFPGGVAEVRRPTRADLVLSAQQWAVSIRERLEDDGSFDISPEGRCFLTPEELDRIRSKFDRLDAVLKELAES